MDDVIKEIEYFNSLRNGDFYNHWSLERLLKEFLVKYTNEYCLRYSEWSNKYEIDEYYYGYRIGTQYKAFILKDLLIWFLKDNHKEK